MLHFFVYSVLALLQEICIDIVGTGPTFKHNCTQTLTQRIFVNIL